jgi:hypothetical protein
MNSHFTQEELAELHNRLRANCTLTAKERILGCGYEESLRSRGGYRREQKRGYTLLKYVLPQNEPLSLASTAP